MEVKVDFGTLATIASIIAAFSISMLVFRIQRELDMRKEGEIVWLPAADWLLILATLISLFVIILPIIFGTSKNIPAAGAAAASIMVAIYTPAILSHYRIVFGSSRVGARTNPEPWELFFVVIALILAAVAFVCRLGICPPQSN